ncbi:hypothetical protein OS493_021656 [Desmophyllum pertusum]|uniref:Major facilitator superfamily (MFS) profile domain-containing protein n=1 Tax=Desmophyllum pertusum TaxID=174260 RepID=A0A9X0CFQ6_9CNID|nr:hypothetical protein OS493_021656 [Desmophyllum pertusum]
MVWFASPLAGYLCDRFGCRITCFLGGVLCIVGLVSTSFVQSLDHMYITYSIVYGLGTCLIYNPCFLVIAKYFKEKLSVATGVVSLGGSVGVLYTGPLLQVLLDAVEWRNTFRITVALYVLVCILSLTFNPHVEEITIVEKIETGEINNVDDEEERSGISLYCSVWTFPTYTVIVTSLTFASFGMYIPYINLVKYCEDLGITAQKASRLFIFIGLASCFARLMTGRLCDDKRVNPVYILSSIYGYCSKRTTAAFCISNLVYSFTAAAGGPVAALDSGPDRELCLFILHDGRSTTDSIPNTCHTGFRQSRKVQSSPPVFLNSEVDEEEEDKVIKVSKEFQTQDQAQEFGMKLRAGTLTRMRSASAII